MDDVPLRWEHKPHGGVCGHEDGAAGGETRPLLQQGVSRSLTTLMAGRIPVSARALIAVQAVGGPEEDLVVRTPIAGLP